MSLISGLLAGVELTGTHGPWPSVCLCVLPTVQDAIYSVVTLWKGHLRVDIKGETGMEIELR